MQSLKLFWDAKQNETLCTWIYFIFFVYCILVLPYRNYGILIWGNTCKTYLDKLLKLQKWAIRTISLDHYKSHTGPLFNKHNVLNVFDTFKLELGVFVYKHQANLPHKLFQIILLNIIKSIGIQQEMLAIIVFIKPKKKKFSDRSIYE